MGDRIAIFNSEEIMMDRDREILDMTAPLTVPFSTALDSRPR